MNWTPIVNKTLLAWLTMLFLAFAALPGATRAGPAAGGYSRLGVPDVPQAVQFFHDVLNCEPIDTGNGDAMPVALLDCGHGNIVELSAVPVPAAGNGAHAPAAIAFTTDNAAAAAAWLRSNHIALLGQPRTIAEGPDAGEVVVGFLTPWGQPLQLVSPATNDPLHAESTATRLAVQ